MHDSTTKNTSLLRVAVIKFLHLFDIPKLLPTLLAVGTVAVIKYLHLFDIPKLLPTLLAVGKVRVWY
jgi:hypothetical protein